jgi:endonuclease/exonuclease/phosphatase family metal-dependent hydrolase
VHERWIARLAVALLLGSGCTADRASSPITLLTLNLANGAGDEYRTPAARARQAAFVASTGAQLIALQEVDLNVQRSGYADCAREVAAIDCTVDVPPFTPDGIRRCVSDDGAVLFGRAFQGDDPYDAVDGVPSGIIDGDSSINPPGTDRSAAAAFGDALVVRGPSGDGYVVELPTNETQVADNPLFGELARDPPSAAARAELATQNQALRRGPAIEPRVVLVTRIPRYRARTMSVLVTHLESGDFAALRTRQLDRVLAVARAERAGPPARDVVVLGDLNQSAAECAAQMAAAGLVDAIGDRAGIAGFDQLWIDPSLQLVAGEPVPTNGVTDHPYAIRAVVR